MGVLTQELSENTEGKENKGEGGSKPRRVVRDAIYPLFLTFVKGPPELY